MNASALVDDLFNNDFLQLDDIENFSHFSVALEPEEATVSSRSFLTWYFVSEWLYRELKDQKALLINSNYGFLWGRQLSTEPIHADQLIARTAKKLISQDKGIHPTMKKYILSFARS